MTQSGRNLLDFRFCLPKIILQNLIFSDAHTSSLMISDSDSDGGDEEIIFDNDHNRQTKVHISGSGRHSGNGNVNSLLV